MDVIRLMIAEDHIMVRESIRALLERDELFCVVAEADDGEECLQLLPKVKPDILILNLDMPKKNGIDVLREFKAQERDFKILVLTGNAGLEYLWKVFEFGVEGYLLKTASFSELKTALISMSHDECYIQPELIGVLKENKSFISEEKKVDSLTERELVVLKYLSFGMYNKEIALKLGISERTVKNHISSIFKKIGVADRTQAAVFAIRNYLVDIYR